MAIYLLIILPLFPVGLMFIRAARRGGGKNLFKQSRQNPTPAMTTVWFVVLLALIVAAISSVSIYVVMFAIYNRILPTVPDAFYTQMWRAALKEHRWWVRSPLRVQHPQPARKRQKA